MCIIHRSTLYTAKYGNLCMKPLWGRQTIGETKLTYSLVLKLQIMSCHFFYRELEALEFMTQCLCAQGQVYRWCLMLSISVGKYAMRDLPHSVNVTMTWPHKSLLALASKPLRYKGTKGPPGLHCRVIRNLRLWSLVQKHPRSVYVCSVYILPITNDITEIYVWGHVDYSVAKISS